ASRTPPRAFVWFARSGFVGMPMRPTDILNDPGASEMASNPQFVFPSNGCTGSCKWVLRNGQWFPTESTCSTGCTCATQLKLQGGTTFTVTPSKGLDDPPFKTFKTRYPQAIVQEIDINTVQVRCVTAGAVIDLS